MIRNMFYMLRNKKGDITWFQIISAIIALIILAIMIYVSIRTKSGMDSTQNKFLDFF